jgi:hypothetical protein
MLYKQWISLYRNEICLIFLLVKLIYNSLISFSFIVLNDFLMAKEELKEIVYYFSVITKFRYFWDVFFLYWFKIFWEKYEYLLLLGKKSFTQFVVHVWNIYRTIFSMNPLQKIVYTKLFFRYSLVLYFRYR